MKDKPLRPTGEKSRRLILRRAKRDERGLTGPQWLLLAAAGAGLIAALALVAQNSGSVTSGTTPGGGSRAAAAQSAAAAVVAEAKDPNVLDLSHGQTWESWEAYFTNKCDRLRLAYSDVAIGMISNFEAPPIAVGPKPVAAELQRSTASPPNANVPQAQCEPIL